MKKGLVLLAVFLWNCGPDPIPEPEATVLLSPANLEACTTASRINNQERQVRFQWSAALHTDSYELIVQNTQTLKQFSEETPLLNTSLILPSGVAYRWYVQTKSLLSPTITSSDVWYFYLEGSPESSHFPYPAVLLSPEEDAIIQLSENFEQLFEWEGNDLDNDILSYDFYLGKDSNQLQLMKGNLTQTNFIQELESSSTYFWQVVTQDLQGNVSYSEINSFKTE